MATTAAADAVGGVHVLDDGSMSAALPLGEGRVMGIVMATAAKSSGEFHAGTIDRIIRIGGVDGTGTMAAFALDTLKLRGCCGTGETAGQTVADGVARDARGIGLGAGSDETGREESVGMSAGHERGMGGAMALGARTGPDVFGSGTGDLEQCGGVGHGHGSPSQVIGGSAQSFPCGGRGELGEELVIAGGAVPGHGGFIGGPLNARYDGYAGHAAKERAAQVLDGLGERNRASCQACREEYAKAGGQGVVDSHNNLAGIVVADPDGTVKFRKWGDLRLHQNCFTLTLGCLTALRDVPGNGWWMAERAGGLRGNRSERALSALSLNEGPLLNNIFCQARDKGAI